MKHAFVVQIPETLEDDVLYISLEYDTAAHLCACGCRAEVVTPLSPAGWELTYDGVSVSLFPSIGNWSLPCRSHYVIERGHVRWTRNWSEAEVKAGRSRDRTLRDQFYRDRGSSDRIGDLQDREVGAEQQDRED